MTETDSDTHKYYLGEAKFSPIPLSVSSPVIKAENRGKIKASAVEAMQHQASQQIAMLKKQADAILQQAKEIEDRVKISYSIYEAEIKFTPRINEVYHLYEKEDKKILSFVSPSEWGKSFPYTRFVASVLLLPDHTWKILSSEMMSNQ